MKIIKLLGIFLLSGILMTCTAKVNQKNKEETSETKTFPTNPDSMDFTIIEPDIATMAVAIVYPRNVAQTNDWCNRKGRHSSFTIDGSYDICGIRGQQLSGEYQNYDNGGFCKCLSQYCDKSEEPDEFLKCIAEYKGMRKVELKE